MAISLPRINSARESIHNNFYNKFEQIYKYVQKNFNIKGDILFYAENCKIVDDCISFKVLFETNSASYILNCINLNLSVSLFLYNNDFYIGESGIPEIKNITSLFSTLNNKNKVYLRPVWKFSWDDKLHSENLKAHEGTRRTLLTIYPHVNRSLTNTEPIWEKYKFCKFLYFFDSGYPHSNKIDELGEIIDISNYVKTLKCIDIPFVGNTYTLVGENYHARNTTRNQIECVLLAETDNEYDDNAIKVLRWFPKKDSSDTMNLSDLFFDLGYISRSENEELHKFMVDNQSRVLFGKIINREITITGGINMFLNSKVIFPKALYNINIV